MPVSRPSRHRAIEPPRTGSKVNHANMTAAMIDRHDFLSARRRTAPGVSPVWALVLSQLDARRQARRYRQWMETRAAAACPGPATRLVAIDDAVAL